MLASRIHPATMKRKLKLLVLALIAAPLIADTITWDAPPASDLVTSAAIHWSTNQSAPFPWPVISTVTNVNTAVVQGATGASVKNYYYVTLINPWGESDPGSVVWRPAKPTNTKVGP